MANSKTTCRIKWSFNPRDMPSECHEPAVVLVHRESHIETYATRGGDNHSYLSERSPDYPCCERHRMMAQSLSYWIDTPATEMEILRAAVAVDRRRDGYRIGRAAVARAGEIWG